MLLDLSNSVDVALTNNGFNVMAGTLGQPYKVQMKSGYEPLIGSGSVPNFAEQEIVIVNLAYNSIRPSPNGEKHLPDRDMDLWGKCNMGFLDPRVRTSWTLKTPFDRIYENGGVFVVFADKKTRLSIQIGRLNFSRQLTDTSDFPHDVWGFISELDDMAVEDDEGTEMKLLDSTSSLGRLVGKYLDGSIFTCTMNGSYRDSNPWHPIAVNKFNQVVALCRCRGKAGSVIVLPQLKDKEGFLLELFESVLPELSPHLFPCIEEGKWVHTAEYELPRVVELQADKEVVIARANAEIQSVEKQIEVERASNGWLHHLLTGTDAQLVEAVKCALSELGFTRVCDVDEERDREGKSRREDLQIDDQRPTLVVDVKGIGGFPADEDALQADKHASIRMREWNRTDVRGLSIINHQRYLPPLDRQNNMPFRQELLDAAEVCELGLMTTWDLFRLVRNLRKNGWSAEDVKPLFYKKSRIEAVPNHYQFIGNVEKAWTDKFGVVIAAGEVHVGDRLAIEFPIEYEEIPVGSIQVNGKAVQDVKIGDQAGFLWPSGLPNMKEKMRVFRIPKTG
ncbi:MAG: hypothetical protein EOL92_04950 [Bacteroidia bacterium]|nr:hypothetical protein [Bacteroidia bacterium]